MKNKKLAAKVRKERTWKHFLYHCNFDKFPPFINNKAVEDYDPEKWRDAFERYQEKGRKALTEEELINIKPILDGQRSKEILLNGLAEESLDFWAKRKYYKILTATQFYKMFNRAMRSTDYKLYASYTTPWNMVPKSFMCWDNPQHVQDKEGAHYTEFARNHWMKRYSDHVMSVSMLCLPVVVQEDLADLKDDFNNRVNWRHKILQST